MKSEKRIAKSEEYTRCASGEGYRSGHNGAVLKTVCGVSHAWVRIPPPPPNLSLARDKSEERKEKRNGSFASQSRVLGKFVLFTFTF